MTAEPDTGGAPSTGRRKATALRLALVGYLLLLVLSNGVRFISPAVNSPGPDQLHIALKPLGDDRARGQPIRIAYRDLGPRDAPALLLLHGTPVPSPAMLPLARELARHYRVIVPDMPGFGGSSLRVADYSFRMHAAYMRALLAALELPAVHVIAYSQGGGPALSLAEAEPAQVKSLSLLSTIGVQELELLGDYHLNQALYVLQYTALQGLQWLTPHFGALDNAILGRGYARNLLDSDQRPLRAALLGYQGPMLILHGDSDGFVPLAAAREHHRLVPQSRLEILEGGHMLTISEPALVGSRVREFLLTVEAGDGLRRADATEQRRERAADPFDWSVMKEYRGIALFVVMLLLALATYVSEDLACITAGLMVARGVLEFVPAVGACVFGIYTGDFAIFLAGRLFGPAAVRRAPLRWLVAEDDLERSRDWFERRGAAVIFISRFIPGTRVASYLVAGLLRMSVLRFSLYFLLAALIWTPLLVGMAYFAGAGMVQSVQDYGRYSLPALLGLALALWLLFRVARTLFSAAGRRAVLHRWRQLRGRES